MKEWSLTDCLDGFHEKLPETTVSVNARGGIMFGVPSPLPSESPFPPPFYHMRVTDGVTGVLPLILALTLPLPCGARGKSDVSGSFRWIVAQACANPLDIRTIMPDTVTRAGQ